MLETWGAGGGGGFENFSVGIWDDALSAACFFFFFFFFFFILALSSEKTHSKKFKCIQLQIAFRQ